MLPSLEKRLKEEGKPKQKKHKKKKKKRKRTTDSSTPEGSSDEGEWVEKATPPEAVERDKWMSMPIAVPTVGVLEARGGSRRRDEEAKRAEREKIMLDRPGQSSRELNPYWRDGGSGLPGAETPGRGGAGGVGDRGADWLRRALQRVREQASEQGRTPEAVAAERWGSLERLEAMLAEAEGRDGDSGRSRRGRSERDGRAPGARERRDFKRPGEGAPAGRDRVHNSTDRRWKKSDAQPREASQPRPPSRSSSSDSEAAGAGERPPQQDCQPLTDKELNELGARLVKAEILGNESLAAELKQRLERGRAARARPSGAGAEAREETVLLTRTGAGGLVHPLPPPGAPEPSGGRRKRQRAGTHVDGKRVRYFADDDEFTLQEMFEREKLTTVDDQNEMFSKMAAKGAGRTGSEHDVDDVCEERASLKESEGRAQAREHGRAVAQHRRTERALEGCALCLDGKLMLKHLLVALGSKVFLSLPPYQSLTEGHCLLAPVQHAACATALDEDVWAEMQSFRKALTAMFGKMDQDVVFFETAVRLRQLPHMALHCVPLPRQAGDLAPIYFKKAILECETEWATNKKLVELAGRDVRRAVPRGLPYFCVDFGLQGGFAHVVEDDCLFPANFAQEIIGGMLDLDHGVWRKQRRENFDAQRKKVVQFAQWWKPFDFTRDGRSSSCSDSD
ncbi:CWF19-like protein 2 isoform X2 [Bacillus rossius redtenbacheri]